jgi:hypothetical protein
MNDTLPTRSQAPAWERRVFEALPHHGRTLPRETNLERNPGLGERLGLRPEVYRPEEWATDN